MVKHVILWQLKDELSLTEKAKVAEGIKTALEDLNGKIPGLIDLKIHKKDIATSNADVMLDSSFESEAALKGYSVHPLHVAAADGFVRPYTKNRVCIDFNDN